MPAQNDSDDSSGTITRLLIEEWKTVIQTQMHFNEMIMRLRGMGVGVVTGIFGAAAYSLQFERLNLHFGKYNIHAAAPIVFFGITLLIAVFILDYHYYFKLLMGAVKRGEELDKYFKERSPELLGMTTLISESIPEAKARSLLLAFYGIPLLIGLVFILLILLGHAPKSE